MVYELSISFMHINTWCGLRSLTWRLAWSAEEEKGKVLPNNGPSLFIMEISLLKVGADRGL